MTTQEQRKYPRIKPPKSVVVAWQSGIQRGVSYVDSIGLGGLFLRTKNVIPLRSLVILLLDMPVGQVRGRAVVRCIQQEKGIGVQIIAMDQEDRARLQRQLQNLSAA
jgi:hypothetical protein